MRLYRVWRRANQNDRYWTLATSEVDAIETVSLTLDIQAGRLAAMPDADAKHDVPYGIVLDGKGSSTTIVRA